MSDKAGSRPRNRETSDSYVTNAIGDLYVRDARQTAQLGEIRRILEAQRTAHPSVQYVDADSPDSAKADVESASLSIQRAIESLTESDAIEAASSVMTARLHLHSARKKLRVYHQASYFTVSLFHDALLFTSYDKLTVDMLGELHSAMKQLMQEAKPSLMKYRKMLVLAGLEVTPS